MNREDRWLGLERMNMTKSPLLIFIFLATGSVGAIVAVRLGRVVHHPVVAVLASVLFLAALAAWYLRLRHADDRSVRRSQQVLAVVIAVLALGGRLITRLLVP